MRRAQSLMSIASIIQKLISGPLLVIMRYIKSIWREHIFVKAVSQRCKLKY